jgi:RNA polymerase sigma factor (sigma-70 family)
MPAASVSILAVRASSVPMTDSFGSLMVESTSREPDCAPNQTAVLTAGMAAGDPASIERFYRSHFDRLYREARRSTGRDEAFCLDVVQESVLRIVRTVRAVADEARLAAWLKLVVRTTAYDMLRREHRRQRHESLAAAPPVRNRQVVDDEPRLAWLRRQITSMDPKLARMIELRFAQRWTLLRIGLLFGLSAGTIDGRLRRALEHLRALAKEDMVSDE